MRSPQLGSILAQGLRLCYRLTAETLLGSYRALTLALTALAAFAAAALLTCVMIPWLAGQGAVASENARTMHQGRVPKGGGLALLIAAIIAAAMFTPLRGLDLVVTICTAIIAYLSWCDDLEPLPASIDRKSVV